MCDGDGMIRDSCTWCLAMSGNGGYDGDGSCVCNDDGDGAMTYGDNDDGDDATCFSWNAGSHGDACACGGSHDDDDACKSTDESFDDDGPLASNLRVWCVRTCGASCGGGGN